MIKLWAAIEQFCWRMANLLQWGIPMLEQSTAELSVSRDPCLILSHINRLAVLTEISALPFDCAYLAEDTRCCTPHADRKAPNSCDEYGGPHDI